MKFSSPTPILRIFDEQKAKEFYIDFLEFQIDWEHRFEEDLPLYFQISKDQCVIHLSEHYGDASPGSAIRIETPDIIAYQQLLLSKNYKNARPGLHTPPWAEHEMYIHDPFGNKLCFFSQKN